MLSRNTTAITESPKRTVTKVTPAATVTVMRPLYYDFDNSEDGGEIETLNAVAAVITATTPNSEAL